LKCEEITLDRKNKLNNKPRKYFSKKIFDEHYFVRNACGKTLHNCGYKKHDIIMIMLKAPIADPAFIIFFIIKNRHQIAGLYSQPQYSFGSIIVMPWMPP
jgi:hypothetical protein